jgi:pantoate kinase
LAVVKHGLFLFAVPNNIGYGESGATAMGKTVAINTPEARVPGAA